MIATDPRLFSPTSLCWVSRTLARAVSRIPLFPSLIGFPGSPDTFKNGFFCLPGFSCCFLVPVPFPFSRFRPAIRPTTKDRTYCFMYRLLTEDRPSNSPRPLFFRLPLGPRSPVDEGRYAQAEPGEVILPFPPPFAPLLPFFFWWARSLLSSCCLKVWIERPLPGAYHCRSPMLLRLFFSSSLLDCCQPRIRKTVRF